MRVAFFITIALKALICEKDFTTTENDTAFIVTYGKRATVVPG
jgi:hypothetical protein